MAAPYSIITGAANVWVSPLGTAFPTIAAAPAVAWFSLGYTDGGITVTHNQSVDDIYVDQVRSPVKNLRTTEGVTVEFAIAQMTLERYGRVLGKVVDAAAGTPPIVEFDLDLGEEVSPMQMLIRGPSPYGPWNLQYELFMVVQNEEPSTTFSRDGNSTLSTSWRALADIARVPPAPQVGRLLAQESAGA